MIYKDLKIRVILKLQIELKNISLKFNRTNKVQTSCIESSFINIMTIILYKRKIVIELLIRF